uniref:Uncharacterized protein n=1 Tax=Anguilla anguilla TaxID=7936 RepID=A0A0E9VDK2_ANGAN
MASSQFPAWSS